MEPGSGLNRLLSTLESMLVRSEDGQTRVWLNTRELQEIKGFIESILRLEIFNLNQKRLIMSMLESVLINKRMTCRDKQTFYRVNSLIIQLLKILVLVLTSSEEDYSDSWNMLVKEEFDRLWLPVKTDSVDLVTTSCNGYSHKTILNSWFSTRQIKPPRQSLQKTSWLYSKFLHADGMEKEATVLRTKKIKFVLTSLQKKQLEIWRHDSRFCYNKAVWLMEDSTTVMSKLALRDLVTPESVNCRSEWTLQTPKAIREAAVFEAYKNRKACFTNLANGNIKHFKQRFLSRKKESWTIGGLYGNGIKREGDKVFSLFSTYNIGNFKCKEVLPELNKTCSIHFDGLFYYLCVPVAVETKTVTKRNPILSSDPGVRTFHTFYDPFNKTVFKVADGSAKDLYTVLFRVDKLMSKRDQKDTNRKTKKLMSKRITKERRRIQNLQRELHWKTAKWVCSKYDTVVLPHFGSKEMSEKASRKIGCKTVRNMMVLAHCKFLERLKIKAQELGTNVCIVGEEYTTKTCGNCYHLQNNIKSRSYWKCSRCRWVHDRDGNASRNILNKLFC